MRKINIGPENTDGLCSCVEECAEKMLILSDPTRLRIIRVLLKTPLNVGEISDLTSLDIKRISHHLGIMKLSGLVEAKKEGRTRVYRISSKISSGTGIDLGCCKINFRPL